MRLSGNPCRGDALYCRSGQRALAAVDRLRERGWRTVRWWPWGDLPGGDHSPAHHGKRVLNHIEQLVAEEKELYARSELSDARRNRLTTINVELDQFWDLLRQRRALREFGRDPDEAEVRPAKVVENYKG